jgi:amino acid transporter
VRSHTLSLGKQVQNLIRPRGGCDIEVLWCLTKKKIANAAADQKSRVALPLDDRSFPTAKVVVATTVALTFISFWRGAAIVLSDLASTMFYVGGVAEQAIGKTAPWFVIAVMLFSFAVRSVYMESCSMFVRGGVYVVVRDSIGPNMAKLSVSALVVDYLLTGPISSVSAGQYLGRLFNEISELMHQDFRVDPNYFAAFFGRRYGVFLAHERQRHS